MNVEIKMENALPTLKEPIKEKFLICSRIAICQDCSLYKKNGGYCTGCNTDYFNRCIKNSCFSNCNICGGGRHARVPACCGRSPLRAQWEKILNFEVQQYTPPPISIKCHMIPVIYPQIKKYRIPEKFPEIDAWVVPIHKIFDRSGKLRKGIKGNLKELLGLLSDDQKLILSTNASDDYQEILWEKGSLINYKQQGIDYWFPGHFSIYDNDSKFYQFANARRQQIHAIKTKSQFVWFRLGKNIPPEFLDPICKAPSVLISTGQMYSNHNRYILKNEVNEADRLFPKYTAFFVVGGCSYLPSLSSQRTCYQINSNWIMKGLRGCDLKGNIVKKYSKNEKNLVLMHNLKETLKNVYP